MYSHFFICGPLLQVISTGPYSNCIPFTSVKIFVCVVGFSGYIKCYSFTACTVSWTHCSFRIWFSARKVKWADGHLVQSVKKKNCANWLVTCSLKSLLAKSESSAFPCKLFDRSKITAFKHWKVLSSDLSSISTRYSNVKICTMPTEFIAIRSCLFRSLVQGSDVHDLLSCFNHDMIPCGILHRMCPQIEEVKELTAFVQNATFQCTKQKCKHFSSLKIQCPTWPCQGPFVNQGKTTTRSTVKL